MHAGRAPSPPVLATATADALVGGPGDLQLHPSLGDVCFEPGTVGGLLACVRCAAVVALAWFAAVLVPLERAVWRYRQLGPADLAHGHQTLMAISTAQTAVTISASDPTVILSTAVKRRCHPRGCPVHSGSRSSSKRSPIAPDPGNRSTSVSPST